MDQEEEKYQKDRANKLKISKTLSKLERIQEEGEEIDELDVRIFDLYKDDD